MQTDIDPRDLIGHKAVDRNGDKIGTIDEVYLDDATGRPEWAAVRTGIFGRDAFVPLTTSEFSGDELRVPYDKSLVKESPDFGVGQHLSPAQELQLYRYYGLDTPVDGRPSAGDGSGSKPADLDFGTTADRGTAAGTAAVGTAAVGTAAVGAAAANTTSATNAPGAGNATSATNVTNTGNSTGTTNGTGTAHPAKPLGLHQSPTPVPSPAADLGKPSDPAPEAPVRTLATPLPTTTTPAAPQQAAEPRPHTPAAPSAAPAAVPAAGTAHPEADGPAASAPSGPVEITCREERLDITTEWHVLGTAKLRKYVTSEPVERRVAVVRERVRVERMPVGDAERAALSEKEIAEAVEEVTLREERPVVRKYLAPIERVRLVVERYTAEEVVRDELRREHVEVHDNTAAASTPVPSAAHAPIRRSRTRPARLRCGRSPDPPGTVGPRPIMAGVFPFYQGLTNEYLTH
ncbi:PRC and DUF2382 domain-containing protein [Streptomyces sp. NRRL S-495]|uniref:PRC and DUF2382 domain-containing protein n=1 Tax=Streptomyces sp. NRRL S-495 TaxID=1609133 RepID=UPI00099C52F2|nr:PRC and DUF2382 domain-containing protein [Streptomyces sp. NRRL S-495]